MHGRKLRLVRLLEPALFGTLELALARVRTCQTGQHPVITAPDVWRLAA